ncbi:MAG: MurR/RpiR family transcriptional regulator [Eubacteriales bacterium]|nr:MurR/RpiR family transcriptional regulator [Eubacteriales bacterium]
MNSSYYLFTNLLSEEETKIVTGIIRHIEKGERRVGIQQLANENYTSATSIMKMCKRLGFDGYSELYYHLMQQKSRLSETAQVETLAQIVDNYSDSLVQQFCVYLEQYHDQKIFTSGKGFSDVVAAYIVQRLSICGFFAFNNVHFYDFMIFQKENGGMATNIEPAVIFAISQSGETEPVINDVRQARKNGYKVIAFTRRGDSTLARLADLLFIVDGARQTLVGGIPNQFFGHVILAFEELMGAFFSRDAHGTN